MRSDWLMALRGHGGIAAPSDLFYADFFFFNSKRYCQDQVMRGCQPARLTLILIQSRTNGKRKAQFLSKAGHSPVGGGCL